VATVETNESPLSPHLLLPPFSLIICSMVEFSGVSIASTLLSRTGLAIEHLHPLVVHFPIALWTFGSILFWVAMFRSSSWMRTSALVAGVAGTATAWLAMETGEWAAHIVGPTLCNENLLYLHEERVETAMALFAGSWALCAISEFVRAKIFKSGDLPWIARILVSAGLFLGMGYLILAGHAGFRLVYEEGVAVRQVQSCGTRP
jgi:uncharacterized membrane protein